MRRVVALIIAATLLTGCVERRLTITSDPPGARVWVNDEYQGQTPLESAFLYHGDYDVRLEAPNHESLHTSATAVAPWWEYPPLDLLAEASLIRHRNIQRWHFQLEPSLERTQSPQDLEQGLLERARQMREQTGESD